ncbi:hypothetical protein [Lentzea sp. NBRC 102530]|uniref:hypothetical protein n=1 Tax=Lentzea sp. NBRC 102530 TaxID=3032201 RepID=UPI0024A4BA09|nr:hypothetical protein [Lentzea sp. NBRC 102530]GLY51417.1 hypothetical protein Lesp01_50730 [Lentzea sp. NBRC 102530]
MRSSKIERSPARYLVLSLILFALTAAPGGFAWRLYEEGTPGVPMVDSFDSDLDRRLIIISVPKGARVSALLTSDGDVPNEVEFAIWADDQNLDDPIADQVNF